MNVAQVVILVISTCVFCFMLFQLWFYIENREYIYEFNEKYSRLKYVSNPSMSFIDSSQFDPNDSEIEDKKKFRCEKDGEKYYALSIDGYVSTISSSKTLSWNTEKECILDLFKDNKVILYNPCALNNKDECEKLKQILG
jgi:hypothetical protein